MPRKEAEIKAAEMKEEQKREKQMFDDIMKSVPSHLLSRIGKGSPIANNISVVDSLSKWGAAKETSDGQFSLSYKHGEAANKIRMDIALKTAMDLFNKFGENFWDRRYTKIIADHAGVDPRTIINYRKKIYGQIGKAKRFP